MKKKLSEFKIFGFFIMAVLLSLNVISTPGCGWPDKESGNTDKSIREREESKKDMNSLQSRLEAYLTAAAQAWGFQGSVLVARGEEIVLKTGLGTAVYEGKIPNTPRTKFLIASMTKTLTAAAVMKLREEGRVSLDETVADYLPEFKDIVGHEMTLRHLLSHTSGLPEFSPQMVDISNMRAPVASRLLVESIRGKEPLFQPGKGAEYSNIGYVLLGLVIEKVSGLSYEDWMEEHIFSPLGMADTGVYSDFPFPAGFACGYIRDGNGNLKLAPYIHPSWAFSAGALFSTAEDLFKWGRALSTGMLLSKESVRVMFRAQSDSFGLGWIVGEAFNRKTAAHGGGAPGYISWMELWPDEEVFTVVLSNVSGIPGGEIGRSLAALVFGESCEMPVHRAALAIGPEVLKEFEGGFRQDSGEISEVVLEKKSLFVIRDGSRFPILPYRRDRFFLPSYPGALIRFVRDGRGAVSGFISHELGVDKHALKLHR